MVGPIGVQLVHIHAGRSRTTITLSSSVSLTSQKLDWNLSLTAGDILLL